MTVYQVIGNRMFRQYQPGDLFEAQLPQGMEQRALRRGAIQVVERSTPSIQPERFTAPAGWPFKEKE